MNKVINIVSYCDSHQKDVYQVTKCGDIYINDDSTDAFLVCSLCNSSSEKEILRTVEEFIDHIKWHRPEEELAAAYKSIKQVKEEISMHSEEDDADIEADPTFTNSTHQNSEVETADFLNNWLLDIIDIFQKCPCLWHSATAESEKQFIDPAKIMITEYLNNLTNRNESVEYVEDLLEKLKTQFLEKCTDENYTPNHYFKRLTFLLTSEMATLDQSIYTDFHCTICNQELESWEYLWDHLCECHMNIEKDDLSSIGFDDDAVNEEEGNKNNVCETSIDNPEFIEDFIETYKNHPRLWDKNDPEYTNRELRMESYVALKSVMQKYNKAATHDTVISKLTAMKQQFRYVRQRIRESKKKGLPFVSRMWYYDKLSFLQDALGEAKKPLEEVRKQKKLEKCASTNLTMITTCMVCEKVFPNSLECLDHIQWAHDTDAFKSSDGFFYCPLCEYPSTTKATFIRHIRHSHSSNFKACNDCGTKFRFLTALAKHRAKEHNDLRPFKCPECGKGFSNLQRMKSHAVIHWDVKEKPYACEICGSKFANRGNFNVHVRRHTRNYKYSCEICGHKSATTTELSSHMLTHTKDYPFMCDVCGKACRNKMSLKLHQDLTHRGVVYTCEICNKVFKSKKSIKNHYDGHKNIADKECTFCGQKYQRADALRKHMRRKHKMLKYQRLSLNVSERENDCSVDQLEV